MGIIDTFNQAQSEYESKLFSPEEETDDEYTEDDWADDYCKRQLEEGLEL